MNKRVLAYFYMPILFFLTTVLILFILFIPYKSTVSLFVNAVTVTNKAELSSKKNFDLTKQKEIVAIDGMIPSSQVEYPSLGTEYGSVSIDKYNVQTRLIYGDSLDDLRVGVGHFNGSVFPGEKGTTLVGGHNTSDLAVLDKVEVGDNVTVSTNYETYQYKITNKEVYQFDDKKAIESLYEKTDTNHLILYTCYPISLIGLTNERLFVYADLVSGKQIDLTQ